MSQDDWIKRHQIKINVGERRVEEDEQQNLSSNQQQTLSRPTFQLDLTSHNQQLLNFQQQQQLYQRQKPHEQQLLYQQLSAEEQDHLAHPQQPQLVLPPQSEQVWPHQNLAYHGAQQGLSFMAQNLRRPPLGRWQSLEEQQLLRNPQEVTSQSGGTGVAGAQSRNFPPMTRFRNLSLDDRRPLNQQQNVSWRCSALAAQQQEQRMELLRIPGRRCSLASDVSMLSTASSMSEVWPPNESHYNTLARLSRSPYCWEEAQESTSNIKDVEETRVPVLMSDLIQDLQVDEGCYEQDSRFYSPVTHTDTLGITNYMRRSSTLSDYDRISSGIESDYERRFSDDSCRKFNSSSLDRRRSSTLSWDFERPRVSSLSESRRDSSLSAEDRRLSACLSEDRRSSFLSEGHRVRSSLSEERRESSMSDDRRYSYLMEQDRRSSYLSYESADDRRDSAHSDDRRFSGYFEDRRGSYQSSEGRRGSSFGEERSSFMEDLHGEYGRDTIPRIKTSSSLDRGSSWEEADISESQSIKNLSKGGVRLKCVPESRDSGQNLPAGPDSQPKIKNLMDWLKTLRLHKYSQYFHNITYSQLLSLKEEDLEDLNITKGARRKMIASISKLKERPEILKSMNASLESDNFDMRKLLVELEVILKSPMPPEITETTQNPPKQEVQSQPQGLETETESEGVQSQRQRLETQEEKEVTEIQATSDQKTCECEVIGISEQQILVDLICLTLRHVCTNLLLSPKTEPVNVSKFLSLLDVCLGCESFSNTQKQLFSSWKLKIKSIWQPIPVRRSSLQFSRRPSFQTPTTHALGRRLSLQNRGSTSCWTRAGSKGLVRSLTTIITTTAIPKEPQLRFPTPLCSNMTSFAPRFQTPSLVRVEQGIPVTRHLSDLHSPTLPGGPSAPSRKDSMPQSGTPVTGAFGLQGRLGSGMLPVTASSQMVGTSGQARVGGIGRFGDQYHHGVVGGAMSRIPEHQTQHDTSSINLQHQQLGRQHSSNQQAQQQYLEMLSAVSLAQPFARPCTPSFNRQHATNPSTCQLANIPRKTTVNIMPLQLQQLQQMGAAAMSHQLSPTSVKFPPRQLHQTVEESSQEVSPDQMEDKTTRKGSKGNIVSIRVTSVDDHIVDQIDFSKASLDTDTSETADQSRDQGFKSADQRKPVKLSLKELNLEKCSVSSLTRMFAQNTPAAFQSLQQRLANLPANVYNNNPQILSQLTSQQQQFTPESQSYAQLRSQGLSSNKPGHQSYPTSPAQPSSYSGQYSSPPGVGRYSDQPRFQFPAPTTVATSSYMRSPHLHSGQDKRFAPPPSAPAVGSNPSFSFDFPLMTEPSTPIEGLPTTSSILTWQQPSNTLGRSQSLNISQVQQSGRAGIVLADLHTQSQKSADLTQQASFGGKEPGEARMDLSFSRFQRMGEIPVEKTEQPKPHQQMAHSGLQTGLYREVSQDSSQYQKGYHEGDRKEFSLTGVDTDKDVSGDGGGDDDQRLESISLSVTRHALE